VVNLFWVLVATYYESEVVLRRLFSFLGVLVSTIAHLVKLSDLEVGCTKLVQEEELRTLLNALKGFLVVVPTRAIFATEILKPCSLPHIRLRRVYPVVSALL
jgi:hypothetical protein